VTPDGWLTVGVVGALLVALASGRVSVEYAMIGALIVLVMLGVVDPALAFHGFADPAVILLGGLFVLASGVTETGAMSTMLGWVLGRPRTQGVAVARLTAPVAVMSAFMNNTPIVAMLIPVVRDWSKRLGVDQSRLLMPLSFAAILGGTCTLIGTASNVIITAEYNRHAVSTQAPGSTAPIQVEPLSGSQQMWWVGAAGLPATVVGLLYLTIAAPRLLGSRGGDRGGSRGQRNFTLEMVVQPDAPVVDKTIEAAGLRQLPGLFLAEIQREGQVVPAPGPEAVLHSNDVLVFVGDVDSVVDLRKMRGLSPATDQVQKINAQRRERCLVQAVVSTRASALLRRTVRESRFRTRYNAAIIAVHRSGERVSGKIGDIRLQAGDVLLMEAGPDFVRYHRDSEDFHLVSSVENSQRIAHERAPVALAIVALFVALLSAPIAYDFGSYKAAVFSVLCACLMIGSRCTTTTIARRAINWQVLLTVAGALGLGSAIGESGAAEAIASGVLAFVEPLGVAGVLLVMFVLVNAITQLVTNAAAAALMFPIAISASTQLETHPLPFALTLVMAVACSFITPIGYQTNLMIVGPGRYRMIDFVKLGLPLTAIVGVVTVIAALVITPG